jgi:hypothetical protein
MLRVILGVFIGYFARGEIMKMIRAAVRQALNAPDRAHSTFATAREDIADAIHEQQAAQRKPSGPV